jgi:hypothetical protein
MSRTLILIAALVAAGSSTASAQYPGSGEEQAACRRDAVHFCRGISDDNQVRSCLIAHRHRISEHCRRVLQAHGY